MVANSKCETCSKENRMKVKMNMKIRPTLLPALFAAASISLTAVPASASETILSFAGSPARITWDRNSGSHGRLFAGTSYGGTTDVDITTPLDLAQSGVQWSFSADFVAGTSEWLWNDPAEGIWIKSAIFENGSFSFSKAGQNFLSGTFTTGNLISSNGSLFFSVGGGDVSYTGGQALAGMPPSSVGDLGFGISGHNLNGTGWNQSGGNITTQSFFGTADGSFELADSGGFSGPSGPGAVPEPGEWAAMGILASGLVSLVVRSRSRNNS